MMKASGRVINLIKELEGCRFRAYDCPAGVCTIGYGHTEGVYSGMLIDEDEAERFLSQDIKKVEDAINQAVLVKLNQNQFDALVSFIFNIGVQAFYRSTLLQKLNTNNFKDVPFEMSRWKYVHGIVNEGLRKRREKEVALFQRDSVTHGKI